MSDDKNLNDDLDDMLDDGKKEANEFSEDTKRSANEFSEDTKRSAQEFSEGAKRTANEFSQGAHETFGNKPGDNKKILAGVLAIILGGFGVHKFVLGYTKEGVIILVITLILGILTCGIAGWVMGILGLIEGIIYLTKSDEEFYNTYQVGKKPWF